jgi:hypothetical protein
MSKIIRASAEMLKKLAIRLGQLADGAMGRPAPKLIPIPVPARSPSKVPPRR